MFTVNHSVLVVRYLLFSLVLSLLSCGTTSPNYYNLPTFSDTYLNAVIEIPAGTNLKIEYNHKRNDFLPDQRNHRDRYIDFLSYPGNYGFIPSTYSDPEKGGDGDALDILVLGESLATGTLQQVIPIGLLKLEDEGALDAKIIAVPAALEDQMIKATSWQQLVDNYPVVSDILDRWFTNYDPDDETLVLGWGDEQEALEEIKKWQVY